MRVDSQIREMLLQSAKQELRFAEGILSFFVEPVLEHNEGMAQLKRIENEVCQCLFPPGGLGPC